jgi:hypothetical protein
VAGIADEAVGIAIDILSDLRCKTTVPAHRKHASLRLVDGKNEIKASFMICVTRKKETRNWKNLF